MSSETDHHDQREAAVAPSAALMPHPNPLREVWSVAWPTVLAMTSYTIMQFTDKLMVGQVGPVELAAQTSGGIWSFSVSSFILGVLTVVNTFVSQNFGAGRARIGPRYVWAASWIAMAVYVIIMIPYALLIPTIFHDILPRLSPGDIPRAPELIRLESGYAQVLIFGSIFLLMGRGINQFFFGMHRPMVVTIGAFAGNITNLVGNYILIFGEEGIPNWGLPGIPGTVAYGVHGAAVATVIGSCVEMAIPALVFLGPRLNRDLATRAAWRPHVGAIKDLFRVGWPAAIQWGNELVCWAIFMTILVGGFGEEHLAACAVAFGYMGLSFMPAVGFSVATNSLVGKYIGAGQPDVAAARARLAVLLGMVYMTACAVVFFVFRRELVEVFVGDGPQAQRVIDIGVKIMICTAFFQTADAIGVIYTGALRGAGDTVWPGVMTMIYSWVLIIGGGYVVVWAFPQLESIGPWLAAAVYIVVYGLTMGLRFRSGRWRSIKLLERAEGSARATAPLTARPPVMEDEAEIEALAAEIAEERVEQA